MSQTAAAILTPAIPTTHPRLAEIHTPLHSGIGVGAYLSLQVVAAVFPLAAGFLVYGWRAAGTAASVILSAEATMLILRWIGWRGRQMRPIHLAWLAMLLSLMLPPHLFTVHHVDNVIVWPLLPAAGMTLALLSWLLGGLGAQRVQPAVATLLVLFVLFHELLSPRFVLQVNHMFLGDVLKAAPVARSQWQKDPWFRRASAPGYDAVEIEPVADTLLAYTSDQIRPDRASFTLQMLIRDQLPPLEDLIIAGQCNVVGVGSGIAIIIGGLFLMYRGLLDFRIPLFGTLSAIVGLLVLPIPIIITGTNTQWAWLAFRSHYLGWATDLTFVNYELLASPLLLTLFFLANTPGLRPITRRGRTVFAILLGSLTAVFQLYASASIGPYVALLIVSLLTPTLDRFICPRTLV